MCSTYCLSRTENPPTPAFAKAGAAPGTTGGVDLRSRVASSGTRHQGNTLCPVSYMPQPSTCSCRLPGLKPAKLSAGLQGNSSYRQASRQQACKATTLTATTCPAICFSKCSRLPFARLQTPSNPKTLPQASKATTLTATCPCHLFFTGFKTAVCPPSNPPKPQNPSAGLQGNNSYSYMPLPSLFQGVQDCRLPALKPPKPFQRSRRPPRQHLLQLHAPAICFSEGSRLPFAGPQTPQTLPTPPQASKATTLTATCPCHLFFQRPPRQQLLQLHAPAICLFRGFKTAVCPPSNPPNPSNASAGLQGNNSYSYMPLPFVFSGCSRLPFARPQTPQTIPTLPQASKATTLTATCPCHLFFQEVQDCRLPALKPPQPLPTPAQASKATTLTATCPCHLFFRGFKTAVCPPSNPPNPSNASAGLQGNNSHSYMHLPFVFQGVQDCRLPALKPPKPFQRSRRTATCPCHLFFRGFKTAVCPPSRSRRPPRQQLLQLHAPAICFFRWFKTVIHRLLWGLCCGTNHFLVLHGFPAGVSWLT